jgi:hypothetical protein
MHIMTNSYELQPFRKMIERASSLIYQSCQWSASCFNALCDDDFLRQGSACTKALLDIIRYRSGFGGMGDGFDLVKLPSNNRRLISGSADGV